jgi:hypothetical protein
MTWLITPALKNPAVFASDPDARAYLLAVEQADGQFLEAGVVDAINAFVIGCKADGIWTAIKASCILAGAKTLAGALIPLVGTAPTNNNFVSGDYNRKTGLVGDGTTKYLDSNRPCNSDPQNNHHLSVYCSAVPTVGSFPALIGSTFYGETGATQLYRRRNATNRWEVQHRNSTSQSVNAFNDNIPCFFGAARNISSTVNIRANNASGTASITSEAPSSTTTKVFAFGQTVSSFADARLAFYSIGESLNLALLDDRVTTLINAFAAAIP